MMKFWRHWIAADAANCLPHEDGWLHLFAVGVDDVMGQTIWE